MKKIAVLAAAMLVSLVAFSQTKTVLKGSLDSLKNEKLIDVDIDFSNGIYKMLPEKEFAREHADWEQIRKETTDRFFKGINKTLKLTKKAAVMSGRQNYTIEVEIINVDVRGNTMSQVRIVNEEGRAIAEIEDLYATGGRFGTFCNLMGDGMEETGEKIGRMISFSLLKKQYMDKKTDR